jgi:hypothetical protein
MNLFCLFGLILVGMGAVTVLVFFACIRSSQISRQEECRG